MMTETDEDRLVELLQQHQSSNGSAQKVLEDEIVELVDTHFRRSLRPVMAKVFGPKVVGSPSKNNGDCQYTTMVNDFFIKVLEKKPDPFWKAKTAASLRTWSSVVIANQMRDYLRRNKRGQEILADIAPLVEQRQNYFEERYSTPFAEFLELLAGWENGNAEEQLMARIVRHRYVDGMSWKDIAADLRISDERLTKIRTEIERRLKKRT